MTSQGSTTVCGLPTWIAFPPANDSTSYINDTVALAVNIPMSIFAFVSNLTIIVIVTRTPQLRTPSNILLCSLAATDCLQGLTSQPLFYIWRLMLHRARQSCDYQIELFEGRYVFNTLTSGWSFATLTLISFDRALALSKPLFYRANVTNEVALKWTSLTGIVWLLLTIFIHFILPEMPSFILRNIFGMLFIILPIMCHIKMYFAIRHQNKQVQDAMESNQQLSIIFKREKKVAVDMFIVIIALLICLGPAMVVQIIFSHFFHQLYDLFYSWSFTLIYLNSCINPVLYIVRKKELRNFLCFCLQ